MAWFGHLGTDATQRVPGTLSYGFRVIPRLFCGFAQPMRTSEGTLRFLLGPALENVFLNHCFIPSHRLAKGTG
jgi:hypothetical protein